jgi:hypothetical protein
MAGLHSLPNEIIQHITDKCDLRSQARFYLTTKYMVDIAPYGLIEHVSKFSRCISDINSIRYEIITIRVEKYHREINGYTIVMHPLVTQYGNIECSIKATNFNDKMRYTCIVAREYFQHYHNEFWVTWSSLMILTNNPELDKLIPSKHISKYNRDVYNRTIESIIGKQTQSYVRLMTYRTTLHGSGHYRNRLCYPRRDTYMRENYVVMASYTSEKYLEYNERLNFDYDAVFTNISEFL